MNASRCCQQMGQITRGRNHDLAQHAFWCSQGSLGMAVGDRYSSFCSFSVASRLLDFSCVDYPTSQNSYYSGKLAKERFFIWLPRVIAGRQNCDLGNRRQVLCRSNPGEVVVRVLQGLQISGVRRNVSSSKKVYPVFDNAYHSRSFILRKWL